MHDTAAVTEGAAPVHHRALRTIAVFEAVKGALAIAAALGFLSLLHRDLHHVVASLIGHGGLDPGGHYPTIILHDVDQLQATRARTVLLAAAAYAAVRLAEAYGLWFARPWGEWLGAVSGAVYLPFELRHLIHRPTLATALVIAVNLVVVLYLVQQLRLTRRSLSHPHEPPPQP